mgnify:CR=1 FL=1
MLNRAEIREVKRGVKSVRVLGQLKRLLAGKGRRR